MKPAMSNMKMNEEKGVPNEFVKSATGAPQLLSSHPKLFTVQLRTMSLMIADLEISIGADISHRLLSLS
jgi:hypothetical protein